MYDNLFYHQATLLTQEQCLWDVNHYMENNSLACLYQCTFDKESFDLSVAERLNIEIPDSVLRSVNKRQAEFTAVVTWRSYVLRLYLTCIVAYRLAHIENHYGPNV